MVKMLKGLMIILYVEDQQASAAFYRALLGREASLDVPGMTEFDLTPGYTLGLMPNTGIARILGEKMPHPATATGIPRCELYLHVDDALAAFEYAIQLGAKSISPVIERNWGDSVGYVADNDGHIIAFAEKNDP